MILMKSKLGQAAFKERSVLFSPRQRAAFILFDGRVSVADVLGKLASLGVTQQDVDEMCEKGLLESGPIEVQAPSTLRPPPERGRPASSPQSAQ